MEEYELEDILKVAKRYNNNKRSYILVNPLQGKHMPISPKIALKMMDYLGKKVARLCKGETKLVIGFAETATAIGAMVAKNLADNCIYIHTTREKISKESKSIVFQEEHSHAVEQKLVSNNLEKWIENTNTIVFVDDELSTGKTVYNMICQMKKVFPKIRQKRLIVASIINRLKDEDEKKLLDIGIFCISLIKISQINYEKILSKIKTKEADSAYLNDVFRDYTHFFSNIKLNPRYGIFINDYIKAWQQEFKDNIDKYNVWDKNCRILILGTEECMLPGLIIGEELEKNGFKKIFFQATTRSPIAISVDNNYPIVSGWQIKSFYGDERKNYIYNLKTYDIVLIVSDSNISEQKAMNVLGAILVNNDCKKIFYLGGNINV